MIKRYFTLFLILSHLHTFLLSSVGNVYAANQTVNTAKSPTTFIDITANGVDLINIANPNSKGVSINHYNKFNVGAQGAILNNSTVMGTSQLGGVVYGNPNLNQNADIILNEVGSTNRSTLKGALEVFGKNAAVVIANPNGFDCNGCSFINTSKLTMVTGRSQLSDGAITRFQLNHDLTADFIVGELGLYANNTDSVSIISRAIKLRGELQTKQDLALQQGNDYYDYITGNVSSDTSVSPIEFGIDVSHLSNISAGSINLIVTEKGAGVNTADGDIITDFSKLAISADGDLVLNANLNAQTHIKLASISGNIIQSGDIKAAQNITINAQEIYQNEGGDTLAQTNLDITANLINNLGGQLAAGENVNIIADTLNNSQNTIQTQGGLIYAKNQLDITAASQVLNDKSSMVAEGNLTIYGANLIIDNKSGVIQSANNISIDAKTLNNIAYRYDAKQNDSDGYYGYDVNDGVNKNTYTMNAQVILEQDEAVSTLASEPSFILADNNITITTSEETNNLSSIISAGNDITINTDVLKNSAINTVGANLAKDIGKSYGIDSFNQGIESMDYWTHKALHAGLGCAISSAKGGDCGSGAAGAAIGEMIAESYTKSQGERLITDSDDVQNEAKLIGRLGAIFTAQAANLDVNDAYDTSSNAIENNNKVIITLGKVSAKLGKKLLQKGKLTKQDLKDAGLDEYLGIVDDLNTIITSGDPVATGLAIADLIIGTNFNSKKTRASRKGSAGIDGNAVKPPKGETLSAFSGAKRLPRKNGRARYGDKKHIYEWDSKKGAFEKYRKSDGKHLGEFDHITGKQTGKAASKRVVKK
jgi:filamentous hemagglutinin family protein